MFYTNFDSICRLRGTSPSAAAMAIGKSKNASGGWKKNGTIPKEDELTKLAEHLDCSVADFFYDGRESIAEEPPIHGPQLRISTESFQPKVSNARDEDVKDFLFIYEACTNRQRNQLMNMIYDFEQKVLQP